VQAIQYQYRIGEGHEGGGECENKIGCGGCNDKNNELIISGARPLHHHHDSYPTGHRHIPISGACHFERLDLIAIRTQQFGKNVKNTEPPLYLSVCRR
jgi:hypothetical protein